MTVFHNDNDDIYENTTMTISESHAWLVLEQICQGVETRLMILEKKNNGGE